MERWDGVGTAAVTLVGSIAYFTRVCLQDHQQFTLLDSSTCSASLPAE